MVLWFVYITVVLITGVPAIFRVGILAGLSGTVSPLIAVFAGGGAVEALTGKYDTPWRSFGFGLVLFTSSLLWVSYTGWSINIGSYHISGIDENIIGGFCSSISPAMSIRRKSKKEVSEVVAKDYDDDAHYWGATIYLWYIISLLVWRHASPFWAIIPGIMMIGSVYFLVSNMRMAASLRARQSNRGG